MPRKPKIPKHSLPQRVERFEIVSREYTEEGEKTILRTYSGAVVVMNIPNHEPDKSQKIAKNIAVALARTTYGDISGVKRVRIIV